jgi:hypothetical protein
VLVWLALPSPFVEVLPPYSLEWLAPCPALAEVLPP